MEGIISLSSIEERITTLRDQKVILDSDVAALYGVETKRINEAVKNNPDKFPVGYIIPLTSDEWNGMKSKFSTSLMPGGKVKLPNAFTEKGLYMLATILKSSKATQTTIAIVETFAKIRELSRTISELSESTDNFKQKHLMQKSGEILADLIGEDSRVTDSETTIELNFAVLKLKHTVKRRND